MRKVYKYFLNPVVSINYEDGNDIDYDRIFYYDIHLNGIQIMNTCQHYSLYDENKQQYNILDLDKENNVLDYFEENYLRGIINLLGGNWCELLTYKKQIIIEPIEYNPRGNIILGEIYEKQIVYEKII